MVRWFTALALLGLACARPQPAIEPYVGKDIQAFMARNALKPSLVRQEAAGATYVFEVVDVVQVAVPPGAPARPQNIENRPTALPMAPGNPSLNAFEPPRAVPGTPTPEALRQAPQTRTRYLDVRTDPAGIIRSYTFRAGLR